MACFSPLTAWQTDSGEIVFAERGAIRRELTLPCGQCVGCKLERSRQWAVRIMHEAQMHDYTCFVTLTYSDEFLPDCGSLKYRDFQLFMKKLRKKLGVPVRFFMCGEYGEKFWRPHFHACLFGACFGDRYPWRRSPAGFQLSRSPLLESIWTQGAAEIGELTFESAAYVARYCMKKITGDMAESHYTRLDVTTGELYPVVPEFCRMSLKPGIGFRWFDKWKADVFPHDYIMVNGMKVKPPRYYDRLLQMVDPFGFDDVGFARLDKALAFVDDCTVDRLRVREIVTRARLSLSRRSME